MVELLNPERIDKKDSTWWFADDKGLWGERPFLHLGERRWEAAERASVERFTTLDLATGALSEIVPVSYTHLDVYKRQATYTTHSLASYNPNPSHAG